MPGDALNLIRDDANIIHDPDLVQHLIDIVIPYPVGSFLLTSEKFLGTITRTTDRETKRPVNNFYIFACFDIDKNKFSHVGKAYSLDIVGQIIAAEKDIQLFSEKIKTIISNNVVYTKGMWTNILKKLLSGVEVYEIQ